MCLVAFSWSPGGQWPLMLVANRDEFRDRPTEPMHWWGDLENPILAGRDLQAGGTWFAINEQGRFALVTNIRPGYIGKSGLRSRGELPVRYLNSQKSISDFHADILPNIHDYTGFNLLLGDISDAMNGGIEQLFWFSSDQPDGQFISPGIHVLSNDALDTPWPKVELARKQMVNALPMLARGEISPQVLTSTEPSSRELLPQTGVPFEWESLLSAQTIQGEHYGTRSRCWLRVNSQKDIYLSEYQLGEDARLVDVRNFNWKS